MKNENHSNIKRRYEAIDSKKIFVESGCSSATYGITARKSRCKRAARRKADGVTFNSLSIDFLVKFHRNGGVSTLAFDACASEKAEREKQTENPNTSPLQCTRKSIPYIHMHRYVRVTAIFSFFFSFFLRQSFCSA